MTVPSGQREYRDPPTRASDRKVEPAPPSSIPSRCRYCGTENLTVWCKATDRNRMAGIQSFTVARCRNCGILQTSPQLTPEEMTAYYPNEYFPDPDHSEALRVAERRKVALVQRFCARGSLLDIGAGIGLFVREAADAGFSAEGIEISQQAVDLGKRSLGVRLTAGDPLELQIPASSYDIVTLWHVLEHLSSPHTVLQRIFRILRESGTLFLAVPNAGSIQARLFRSRWFHLDVPRHQFHYTPVTLAHVLHRAGFEVQHTIFRDKEHDPAGILGSLMRLSAPGESMLHKGMRKALGMPAATLLAAGEALIFGESGTFVAIARKEATGNMGTHGSDTTHSPGRVK